MNQVFPPTKYQRRRGLPLLKNFRNIKDSGEFRQLVEMLWADDYDDLELESFPTTVFGGFAPWRVEEFLRLAKLHPEYHIVSCIEAGLYVNQFV